MQPLRYGDLQTRITRSTNPVAFSLHNFYFLVSAVDSLAIWFGFIWSELTAWLGAFLSLNCSENRLKNRWLAALRWCQLSRFILYIVEISFEHRSFQLSSAQIFWWCLCGCTSGGDYVDVHLVFMRMYLWWRLCGCTSDGDYVDVPLMEIMWMYLWCLWRCISGGGYVDVPLPGGLYVDVLLVEFM